jgi:hypothetical protein
MSPQQQPECAFVLETDVGLNLDLICTTHDFIYTFDKQEDFPLSYEQVQAVVKDHKEHH